MAFMTADYRRLGDKVYLLIANKFARPIRLALSNRIRMSHQISTCPATLQLIGIDKPASRIKDILDREYTYKTINELEQERHDSAYATLPRNL